MDAGEPTPVDLRDYVAFDLAGPCARRVFTTDVVAVDLVCLEPGQVVAARTSAGADTVYTVLGGVAWVVTDDAEVTLNPLQAVLVPAGVPHGLRNDGADPLLLHVVVSPPQPGAAEPPPGVAPPPAAAGPPPPSLPHRDPSRPGLADRLRRTLGG
jgi:quercetin dioxygenase-like cupin family protein